jgi:hypothetical protein
MLPEIFKKEITTTDPDEALAFQLMFQASQNYQLLKMRKLEESKIPTGTNSIKVYINSYLKLELSPPLISFTLINKGPSALSMWVNESSDPQNDDMISAGASFRVDMGHPIINIINLKATDATVQILGIQGKQVHYK